MLTAFRTFDFQTNYSDLEVVYDFKNKQLNKSKIDFVVTHGSCIDGFMSATIVNKWLNEQKIDTSKITFVYAHHGKNYDYLLEQMENKNVLICDFAFHHKLFTKMIEVTKGNILVLDHHKTAEHELKDFDNKYVTFDMNHSGAFITWTYMYGFDNVPKSVLYVEDNDIWLKKLPNTKEFTSFVFSRKFEFDEYDKLFDESYITSTVFSGGSGMVLQNELYIEKLITKSIPHFIKINNRFYFVACLNNAGILTSELGNSVFKYLPNTNFSMIYSHDQYGKSTGISFRSTNDRSDVSIVAKSINGGGGHRNASGCQSHYMITYPGTLLDEHRVYKLLNNLYVQEYNEKKVIILNTTQLKLYLCSYLMQERYYGDESKRNKLRYEKKLPGYQEALYCMRNKLQNQELDEHYEGALIWNYDGKQYDIVCQFINNELIINNIKKDEQIKYELNRNKLNIQTSYSIEKLLSIIL